MADNPSSDGLSEADRLRGMIIFFTTDQNSFSFTMIPGMMSSIINLPFPNFLESIALTCWYIFSGIITHFNLSSRHNHEGGGSRNYNLK